MRYESGIDIYLAFLTLFVWYWIRRLAVTLEGWLPCRALSPVWTDQAILCASFRRKFCLGHPQLRSTIITTDLNTVTWSMKNKLDTLDQIAGRKIGKKIFTRASLTQQTKVLWRATPINAHHCMSFPSENVLLRIDFFESSFRFPFSKKYFASPDRIVTRVLISHLDYRQITAVNPGHRVQIHRCVIETQTFGAIVGNERHPRVFTFSCDVAPYSRRRVS